MIYRHSEEMKNEYIKNMRGGEGIVNVKHILNPEEMLGKGRLFAENTVPVGASIGLHPHEGDIEAYYYLKGKGIYYNNVEEFEVKAGDLTVVDDHNSHSIKNTGDEPLVFVALILFTGGIK